MRFLIYDNLTGEIKATLRTRKWTTVLSNTEADQSYIEHMTATPKLNHVDVVTEDIIDKVDQSITQDMDTILADGIESSTFSGVAEGSKIFINDAEHGVMDDTGDLSITFDTVGNYDVKFVMFPYLETGFKVHAG